MYITAVNLKIPSLNKINIKNISRKNNPLCAVNNSKSSSLSNVYYPSFPKYNNTEQQSFKIRNYTKFIRDYNLTYSDIDDVTQIIQPGNYFKIKKVCELNYQDNIFDSIKKTYNGFDKWWQKIQNRDTFVYFNNEGTINAILIPKIERNEIISQSPLIKKDKILKICTFKTAEHARGLKLGKNLLNLALKLAQKNDISEIYFSHYIEKNDYLVKFMEQFGFKQIGCRIDNEAIFLKKI